MYKYLIVCAFFLFFSCGNNNDKEQEQEQQETEDKASTDNDLNLEDEVDSNYDMSTVDVKDRQEFKENLEKIEKEHGEQWDFCTCVVKNDSINKAFADPVSDDEFDRLSDRFDVIDKHCKAFLAQNPNQTPEERLKHEKKVNKCLKSAGIE